MRGIGFSPSCRVGVAVGCRSGMAGCFLLCLTRAHYCRTLGRTVLDNFAVSWRNCTGLVTGPVEAGAGMLSLTVSPRSDQPLADQIVAGIKRQIDDRHLRPGSKLPSIRNFAEIYRVSRFTVVEAYDRLG